jgi:hypothetical protein
MGLSIVQYANTRIANENSISLTIENVGESHGILIEVAVGGSPDATLSSIVDSGGTVQTAVAFTSFDYPGLGRYYIPASSDATHEVTVTFEESVTSAILFLAEVNGPLALDTASQTATGTNSASPASNSVIPAAGGEFLSGFIVANGAGNSFESWGGGFTQEDINTNGPTAAWAYLSQSAQAPANAAATLGSAATYWMASVVAYSSPSMSGAPSDTTSAAAELSTSTAPPASAIETAYEEWIQSQNELPGPIQVPSLPTSEELYRLNHPDIYAGAPPLRGFSAPSEVIIGVTPAGYVNLASIFPFTGPGGSLIFYDCTAPEFATTENQVLSLDASQITAGVPISLITPANPAGQKFVSGITVSCPAGMSYQVSYYINYP